MSEICLFFEFLELRLELNYCLCVGERLHPIQSFCGVTDLQASFCNAISRQIDCERGFVPYQRADRPKVKQAHLFGSSFLHFQHKTNNNRHGCC